MSGPYREEVFRFTPCGACNRAMSPLQNARRSGDKIICMNCYELHRLMPEVRAAVKRVLALATADQRMALVREWLAGYCRHCGEVEKGYTCACTNDE